MLYITKCGLSEQYVPNTSYCLCEYRGEVFTDAYGLWRRNAFLPNTKWVVYHLEKPVGDINPLRISKTKEQVSPLRHPANLIVVPILPSVAKYALSCGATVGVEFIDGNIRQVAIFPEDDLRATNLAKEMNAPIHFYDKSHFYRYVECDRDLQRIYTDSDPKPKVLGIWMNGAWAVYVR